MRTVGRGRGGTGANVQLVVARKDNSRAMTSIRDRTVVCEMSA